MRKIIPAVAFVLLLSACNQSKQSVAVPEAFEARLLTAIMKDPETVSKETLAKIAGTDALNIKIYNENFSTDVSQRTILFSWLNGEKQIIKTASGKELSINAYNSLGLGFVQKTSKEDFRNKFESRTFVQQEINRITKDETIDADLAIAEAKYLAQNAKMQQFEKLENVGELAYWETPINALHIFANGVSFTVTTNLENEKSGKEKAIELVQFVFSNPLKSSK